MAAGPAWQDDDLIFCQADGRPWNPDYVSKRFKKLAAQAGVPVMKLHEGGRMFGRAGLPLLRKRVLLTARSQPAARKIPGGRQATAAA
jgi:hypothetical protein